MDRRGLWTTAGLALVAPAIVAISTGPVDAAPRANSGVRRAVRQENARRRDRAEEAEENESPVSGYAAAVTTAEATVVKAQAALKEAGQSEAETRTRITLKHERALGLPEALNEQREARAVWEAAAGPVLEALRKTPEFSSAEAQVAAAKEKRARGLDVNEFVPVPRRGEPAPPATGLLAVQDLERRTLESDPQTRPLRTRLVAAQSRVLELNKKLVEVVAEDQTLRSAETATYSARTAVEAAEDNLVVARGQLTAAETMAANGVEIEKPRSRRSKSSVAEEPTPAPQ